MQDFPKYPKLALMYAEYALKSYPQAKQFLEDKVYSIAYSMFSAPRDTKDLGVKIISHRQSDPTYEAAMKLLSDPSFVHLAMIVRAVEATLDRLVPSYKAFVKTYFWEGKVTHDLRSKRMRRQILTMVCHYLGVPIFQVKQQREAQ